MDCTTATGDRIKKYNLNKGNKKNKAEKNTNGSDMATTAFISHMGSLAGALEGLATPRICRAVNAFTQFHATPGLPRKGNMFSSLHGAALQGTRSSVLPVRAAPSKV